MRVASLLLRLAALAAVLAVLALLHHGHIQMFLSDVRDRLTRGRSTRLAGATVEQASSHLQVHFGDPAVHYEVAVHRKSRSVEVGLHFEGAREENDRWLALLAGHADAIRAQLGSTVELEPWTRGWARLHDSRVVSDDDWRPKRDLTPALARDVAQRLVRFIRALEPLLERERRRHAPAPSSSGANRSGTVRRHPDAQRAVTLTYRLSEAKNEAQRHDDEIHRLP